MALFTQLMVELLPVILSNGCCKNKGRLWRPFFVVNGNIKVTVLCVCLIWVLVCPKRVPVVACCIFELVILVAFCRYSDYRVGLGIQTYRIH